MGGVAGAELFDSERDDLAQDLRDIPRNAAIRRVNELVKRARKVKAHALLCACLRKMMPTLWGQAKKQKELIENLDIVFQAVATEHGLSQGDFPNVHEHRRRLERWCETQSLTTIPRLNRDLVTKIDQALSKEIPELIKSLSAEGCQARLLLNPQL
ncbi:hypothetical protein T484DRAFT_1806342 [Baffinella frigidus]|nr:hypothetical protein T484DRAFT_1806342 [Cryptophyta sp. CCMP2293]